MSPSFGVYCVCLPSRRQHADMFFEALGLVPTYTHVQLKDRLDREGLISNRLLDAKCTMNDGEIACALSHRNAWEMLINDGYDYGLFFEDDNVIPPNPVDFSSLLQKMVEQECMYLNLSPCWSTPTLKRGMCKATGYCTNAYILHKEAVVHMMDKTFPLKHPVDTIRIKNQYEIHPRLFRQLGALNTELNNKWGNPEYDFKTVIPVCVVLVLMLYALSKKRNYR